MHIVWLKSIKGNCSFKNPSTAFHAWLQISAMLWSFKYIRNIWGHKVAISRHIFCIYIFSISSATYIWSLCHRAEWNPLACEGSFLKLYYPYFYRLFFSTILSQDTNIIQVLQRCIACTLQTISGIASG